MNRKLGKLIITSLLMAARGRSPTSMLVMAAWHSVTSATLQHDGGTLNRIPDTGATFHDVFGIPISGAVVS